MKSVYNFVVTPKGKRYNNTKQVGDKELILNTDIFNHQYLNRNAIVLSKHIVGDTDIIVGDEIIIHHNVFRRWHNVQNEEKNSRSYINEDHYLVNHDQIFLHKHNNNWRALDGYCFVQPIKETSKLSSETEKPLVGIITYTDGTFETGDLVGFTPVSKYEFVIDGKRLYRVMTKFITIKYEYQGNEEAYNPSWAQGS